MLDDPSFPTGLITLSNAQYHGCAGISSTQIKTMNVPLNFWDQNVNPDREPREEKHCFAVGDGTHKLVLEPGTFEQTYAVGFDKAAHPKAMDSAAELKKACSELGLMVSGTKPELAERLITEGKVNPETIMLVLEKMHEKTMNGKIAIPAKDYKNMLGMLNAVNRDPEAKNLLHNADTEQSFFYRHTLPCGTKILMKCRTDLITADYGFIGDLKTTDDVSEEAFGRTIANFGYHVSAAWYLDIMKHLYGDDAPEGFFFIAVQKTRPYDVGIYYLTQEQLRLGRAIYQSYLARLAECVKTNYWPGATGGKILPANIPKWEMQKLDYFDAEKLL